MHVILTSFRHEAMADLAQPYRLLAGFGREQGGNRPQFRLTKTPPQPMPGHPRGAFGQPPIAGHLGVGDGRSVGGQEYRLAIWANWIG